MSPTKTARQWGRCDRVPIDENGSGVDLDVDEGQKDENPMDAGEAQIIGAQR